MSIGKINKGVFEEVLERLRLFLGYEHEYQVGDLIGLSRQALTNRKKSGSIPRDKIKLLCIERGVDFNWIMTGEGEMKPAPVILRDPQPEYLPNSDQEYIERQIRDKPELAAELRAYLQGLEAGFLKQEKMQQKQKNENGKLSDVKNAAHIC